MTPSSPLSSIDPARIDANWRAITIELDAPRPSRIERLLRMVGFPASATRIMVATPALRRSWFLAVGVIVLVGLAGSDATQPRSSLFTFLLLAPLLPALGVSMAYGVEADPAHEVGLATPRRGLSILLTRAAAVLTLSVGALGLVSVVLAESTSLMAAAWLLLSLALSVATVGLMSVLTPRRSLALVLVTWGLINALVRTANSDPLAAFGVTGQIIMALTIAVGAALILIRRGHYDRLEVSL